MLDCSWVNYRRARKFCGIQIFAGVLSMKIKYCVAPVQVVWRWMSKP